MKFFKCKHCGNIITKVKDMGVPVSCCGEEMEELVANTVDAAVEKHVPFVSVNDNKLTVSVGEVLHPMEETHYIEFILIETEHGICIRKLNPTDNPVIESYFNSKVLNVYAYCNLHGLWKACI